MSVSPELNSMSLAPDPLIVSRAYPLEIAR
jgi:hypothetical protein